MRAEISRHDELYYRKAQPEISDADYDALKNELTALTEQFPEEAARLGAVATATIGDDRAGGFPSAAHRVPMLSLEKAYTESALKAFCRKAAAAVSGGEGSESFVVEPKFDGLGVSAVYERGRLSRVITRGDGLEGDDVSLNARRIAGLPSTLKATGGAELPDFVEVRGEVYMSFAEFDRLNREREEAGEVAFASPRNLAVATLKASDPELLNWRRLEIVFYGLGACEPPRSSPGSQREWLTQLSGWGLPTVEHPIIADTPEAVWRAVAEIGRVRGAFAFPVDGAVVKLDSAAGQRQLGNSDHAPRWAMAFKYSPERATSRVKAITIQVGRTGVLTPVAELEPVRLGGATIRRATLHNAAEIARRDIRLGDQVFVERTGEVIPAVVGVDLAARESSSVPYQFPAACPACGAAATRREGEVTKWCPNLNCPAQLGRRILHFASDEGVGIRGLREGTIAKLVDGKVVRDLPDLFRLKSEDLVGVGVGAKAAETLTIAIAATRHTELWRFVNGLGIRGVGVAGAKALAAHFGSLEAMAVATEQEFSAAEGLGPEAARSAAEFFGGEDGRAVLGQFKALDVWPRPFGASSTVLAGKTFVVTGTLATLSRSRALELIEAAGGRVVETVSRKTTYVVAGSEPGAKVARARELGVTVLDEAGLLRLLSSGAAK